MGQKTNPNILRLGKIKEWKSKYIEKKTTESSTIIFKDLEIRKFISQLFAKNGLHVQECKTAYSESSLNIYINFYNSTKIALRNSVIGKKEKIKLKNIRISSTSFLNKLNKIKHITLTKQLYTVKTYQKTFDSKLKKKIVQNQYLLSNKTHRLRAIKNFKTYDDERKYKTLNKQISDLFILKILKSLNLFLNKKKNIFLNLKQINHEKSLLQKISKKSKKNIGKNFIQMRKFQQNKFLKKGFNILYNFIINNHDPTFLAKFIALYIKKLKRPKFFLQFLRIALKTLINKNFSKLKRIQIKIKGRFNGAPRSRHKFITIGKNIPVLTLNSNISYGESTAYTSNGTFGVKVWTYATTIYHV